MKKLSDQEIKDRLEFLNSWKLVDGKLNRSLTFKDFNEAFGFMSKAAPICEEIESSP